MVSVIMSVRNEGSFISKSLGAILSQNYPQDRMEVIVADGLSTDGTREIIRGFQIKHSNLSLMDNPKKIVAPGLNKAIRQSKGDIVVRVDGHTIIARDYVLECVRALKRTGAQTVGGRMNAVHENFFGQAAALATSSPFGVGGAKFHYSEKEEMVDTVYMGAWHKAIFDRVGFFDEELVRNQDDEMNYRIRKQGGKILLSPRIKSIYYGRSSPQALVSQYFQYGYWKVRVAQKHPRQMRLRHFVPAMFVAGGMLFCVLGFFSPPIFFIFEILASLYLVLSFVSALLIAKKTDWKFLPILPLVYLMLHVSYGIGFIAGLFRFAW